MVENMKKSKPKVNREAINKVKESFRKMYEMSRKLRSTGVSRMSSYFFCNSCRNGFFKSDCYLMSNGERWCAKCLYAFEKVNKNNDL